MFLIPIYLAEVTMEGVGLGLVLVLFILQNDGMQNLTGSPYHIRTFEIPTSIFPNWVMIVNGNIATGDADELRFQHVLSGTQTRA